MGETEGDGDEVAVSHVLREAERRLAAAGLGSPDADARLLLAHTLGVEPVRLLTREAISTGEHEAYADLVAARAEGVPLQHLTEQTTFRHSRLRVGPGVFVPRPETEVMTGWVLEQLAELAEQTRGDQSRLGRVQSDRFQSDRVQSGRVQSDRIQSDRIQSDRVQSDRVQSDRVQSDRAQIRVVDLCTGSGAIARALWDETGRLHDRLELHALELSDDAIGYAAANLAGTAVTLHHADLADAPAVLAASVGSRPVDAQPFDIVVANPPYIPLDAYEAVAPEVRDHEPALALFSGADGLDAVRVLARVAATLLRPGGWLACEHAEVQAAAITELLAQTANFTHVRDHPDLTGRPRFVTARRANVSLQPKEPSDLAGWTA